MKKLAPTALLTLGLMMLAAPAEAQAETALDVLDRLTVAEDHYCTEYSAEVRKDLYAPRGWVDANDSGHDTRDDILIRDLEDVSFRESDGAVEYGQTIDPYSGEQMEHVLGESQVDIEHVVAIGQAHRNGACAWDTETQQAFYQDQENLLAVSASENRSKSDRDITEYLPSNQGAYCDFAGTIIFVKDKWELSVNPAERDELQRVLSTPECEGQTAVPAVSMTGSEAVPVDIQITAEDISEDPENPEAPELQWWHAPLLLVGIVLGAVVRARLKTEKRA
ncbi:HNH endonuclease family protein [Nesterenkonia rhizosphaerae]|uniref:GmrSD restriction endonucleases C-terminal domain-containing protein n=1 Tax=Nesterenkonia rhizosphaerae TaxID=1348272 RepID=A0ABP9G3Y3_9MICC